MLRCGGRCMQDEERAERALNTVASLRELNESLARSEDELNLFNALDAQLSWPVPSGMLSVLC